MFQGEHARDAIRHGPGLLASSPFRCSKAAPGNTFLRELLSAFGASGHVALFEIDDAKCWQRGINAKAITPAHGKTKDTLADALVGALAKPFPEKF